LAQTPAHRAALPARKNPHPLNEVGGPIPRVVGGPFSGHAAANLDALK
jgi:hypothetical protein